MSQLRDIWVILSERCNQYVCVIYLTYLVYYLSQRITSSQQLTIP